MARQRFGRWGVIGAMALGLGALTMATGSSAGSADPAGRRVAVPGGAYTDIDPPDLAAMLQHKTFPLINVHVPYEGEIAGTDLLIPFDQIQAHLAELPADKNARIVLYCRTGPMSATAARELVKLGYRDVWNLAGGMRAWERSGHPIVQRPH